MKEHPILFSGPMVKAILEGRKSQTRRVMKNHPDGVWGVDICGGEDGKNSVDTGKPWWKVGGINGLPKCPYGQPGDRLWVRETWAPGMNMPQPAIYRADWPGDEKGVRWKPSIHMPRWASRILLEVTDVRVQRVQEISEEDALAEGTRCHLDIEPKNHHDCSWSYKEHFEKLWDSINAKRGYGWDVNPWVWAISFRRIRP
jgi:hypothetical protein